LGMRVPAHIELGFFTQANSQRALVFRPTLDRLGAKSRAAEPDIPRGTSQSPGFWAVPLLAPEAICSLVHSLSVATVLWHPRQPPCCTSSCPRAGSPFTGGSGSVSSGE